MAESKIHYISRERLIKKLTNTLLVDYAYNEKDLREIILNGCEGLNKQSDKELNEMAMDEFYGRYIIFQIIVENNK